MPILLGSYKKVFKCTVQKRLMKQAKRQAKPVVLWSPSKTLGQFPEQLWQANLQRGMGKGLPHNCAPKQWRMVCNH
jgi:hypothetical protein